MFIGPPVRGSDIVGRHYYLWLMSALSVAKITADIVSTLLMAGIVHFASG